LSQRLGLRERTLVVCVSDHGEEFWEHGGVEHGHAVYDELVQVPLIMRWPGHLPAGTFVGAVTRMTDIAPTVLELLGVSASQPFDGLTLLPLLRGEETAARVALVENLLFADARVGLRTPERKYVRWDTGKEETYDLVADPREQRDLAGVPPVLGPLRELHAQVERGLEERSLAASAVPSRGSSSPALRALGYVQ
jgi:arylsulfatase A-like enzyme